jgi:hypothetical protein
MKLLVIADVHGTERGIYSTIEKLDKYKPDLLIVCGDITHHGPAAWAGTFLDQMYEKLTIVHRGAEGRSATRNIRVLAVPGNCDPIEILEVLNKCQATNLHRAKVTIGQWTFVGLGGSNITPFHTIFEYPEETLYTWLAEIMVKHAILVVHTPPRGYLDLFEAHGNLGSTAIANIVDLYKPTLVLSAHVHEARGVLETDDTIFVNPGPARDGYGAIVELKTNKCTEPLSKKIKVKLLS